MITVRLARTFISFGCKLIGFVYFRRNYIVYAVIWVIFWKHWADWMKPRYEHQKTFEMIHRWKYHTHTHKYIHITYANTKHFLEKIKLWKSNHFTCFESNAKTSNVPRLVYCYTRIELLIFWSLHIWSSARCSHIRSKWNDSILLAFVMRDCCIHLNVPARSTHHSVHSLTFFRKWKRKKLQSFSIKFCFETCNLNSFWGHSLYHYWTHTHLHFPSISI